MSGWHKMKVRLDKASGCVHEIDRDEDGKPLLLVGQKMDEPRPLTHVGNKHG